jgi:hypothetical protein
MAKEYALTVEVPEFDEVAAYNHDRPISGLIRTQLHHLHIAEQHLLPKQRTNVNINDLLTERQASDYIARVTALLHQSGEPEKPKATYRKKPKAKKSNAVKKNAGKTGRKTKSASTKTSKHKPAARKRR